MIPFGLMIFFGPRLLTQFAGFLSYEQVVITKCYHLFCNPCVQRVVETRHRKCPVCAASFGSNDVKPVYI